MRISIISRITALALCLAVAEAAVVAQQPSFPPIKPDAAKLVQTLGGLDGPGWGLAADDLTGMLVAACEQGTIQFWDKEVTLGLRTGDSTPNVLKGHAGP